VTEFVQGRYECVAAADARKEEDSNKLEEYSSYELRVVAAEAHEQTNKQ
jgi:hypothetical protein